MAEQCCPPFEPEKWDQKTFTWAEKKFAKEKVGCLFYMPVGFGRTMKRLMGKVERARAECPDWLCLSDHTSKWNMDVYLAVDRDLPDAQMSVLDGSFVSKVYEGPFRDTGKWCADFAEHVRRQGVETEKLYMWYTTCPKCAKERGKNYVVVLGQVRSTQPGAG